MKIHLQMLETTVTPRVYEVEVDEASTIFDAEAVALTQLSDAEREYKNVPDHWRLVETKEPFTLWDYDDGYLEAASLMPLLASQEDTDAGR